MCISSGKRGGRTVDIQRGGKDGTSDPWLMEADDEDRKRWKESMTSDQNIGQYKVERVIAFGGFGCVRECINIKTSSAKPVAVKTFARGRLQQKDTKGLDRELAVLKRAKHPNIIQFHEVVDDAKFTHVVMEYARGGDLYTQIKRHGAVGEPEASRIFMQLIQAIEYLHKTLKVCHRDIKLENLLFTDLRTRNLKLIDFNLSSFFKGERCIVDTARGTPSYAAPEVIRCMEAAGLYSELQPEHIPLQNPKKEGKILENTENNEIPKPTTITTTKGSTPATTTTITATITTTAAPNPSTRTNCCTLTTHPPTPPTPNPTLTPSQILGSEVPNGNGYTSPKRTERKSTENPRIKSQNSTSPHAYDACLADIWSCGVVLFIMVYGYMPFYEQSVKELCVLIKRGLPRPLPGPASLAVRDLILRILEPQPEKRMLIAEMRNHLWLRSRFQPESPEKLPEAKTISRQELMSIKLDGVERSMSTVTNLANDKQTTDSNKTSNQHHREPNWYDKLHVGDLHAHMEEDDDDQSARHSHVTSSASQLWEDAQGRTGTSGESWSAAKHQAKSQRKDEEKLSTLEEEQITHAMLLQHIDEEEEEEVEDIDEEAMGWYYRG